MDRWRSSASWAASQRRGADAARASQSRTRGARRNNVPSSLQRAASLLSVCLLNWFPSDTSAESEAKLRLGCAARWGASTSMGSLVLAGFEPAEKMSLRNKGATCQLSALLFHILGGPPWNAQS